MSYQNIEEISDIGFTRLLDSPSDRLQTEVWFRLVESYTLRFLSKDSDRLPAIQGLATRLERKLWSRHESNNQYRYCHGLFDSHSIALSLLRYLSDARTARPSCRAPSWSWASVDGSIKNNSTLASWLPSKCGLELINGPSRTGGTVHVRGKLRLGTWRKADPDKPQDYYLGHHHKLNLKDPHYHQQFVPVSTDRTSGPEVYALYDFDQQVGYFLPDTDEDLPTAATDGDPNVDLNSLVSTSQIFCLQIIVRPQDHDAELDFSVPWATRCLALIRTGPHSDFYRRVGYNELSRDHPGMEFFNSSPDKGRNRRKRPYPVVDPHNFFQSCAATTIEII